MSNPAEQKSDVHNETAPIMVFLSAASFLDAADRQHQWLKKRRSSAYIMPVYLLYGQGIELMLKAFLRTRRFTDRELRNEPYRHDVLELYQTCRKHGLWDDVDGTSMAGCLVAYYNSANWHNTFRYVSESKREFPKFEAVGLFARILLEAIQPVCEGLEPLEAAMLLMQNLDTLDEEQPVDTLY